MSGDKMLHRVWSELERREDEYFTKLCELIRQPSVSTTKEGLPECAALVLALCRQAGMQAEILHEQSNPIVYAEWLHPRNRFTLLLYGHYDVKPAGTISDWDTPPFEPHVRNGRIYARGSGDNKGQFIAHIAAIHAYLRAAGTLPCNIKCLFEGEEEIASPHLAQFVARERDRLSADLVVTSDGPIHESGRPVVVLGVRGILKMRIRVQTAERTLHSGNYGGMAPNPIQQMNRILDSFHLPNGHIAIEGFHDRVRTVGSLERSTLAGIPFDSERARSMLGINRFAGEGRSGELKAAEILERTLLRPTINLAGISGGEVGPEFPSAIPPTCEATLDVRLVADQEPDAIFDMMSAHVHAIDPDAHVGKLGAYRPSRTPLDHPLVAQVTSAVSTAWNAEPILYPNLGGSTPDAIFTQTLGVPSILVPYANFDENNHAPNENLALECWRNGMRTTAAVMHTLGFRTKHV